MRVDEKRIRAWRHAFRIHWPHTEQHERQDRMFEKCP
jgi:hypothetical protein